MDEKAKVVRCAIYTRNSTEEGLEQEFNSLQAQREAGEACIASQRQAGWEMIAHCYDDGGFSGASMDRPALRQLLATKPLLNAHVWTKETFSLSNAYIESLEAELDAPVRCHVVSPAGTCLIRNRRSVSAPVHNRKVYACNQTGYSTMEPAGSVALPLNASIAELAWRRSEPRRLRRNVLRTCGSLHACELSLGILCAQELNADRDRRDTILSRRASGA